MLGKPKSRETADLKEKLKEIVNSSSSRKKKLHAIIHVCSGAAAAVGAGLANIPGSDAPVLVGIQTAMIVAIGAIYNQTISESLAKSMIAEFLGVNIGKIAANILTGWLPGIGNGVNAATAASLTELIGWTVAKDFENGTDTIDAGTADIIKERIKNIPIPKPSKNNRSSTNKKGIIKKK